MYTEEKFEDEEDMRERTRAMFKDSESGSDFDHAFAALNTLALQHEALRPIVVDVLNHLSILMSREVSLWVRLRAEAKKITYLVKT